MKQNTTGGRLALLDTLRGGLLISMILYHASWDLVYLFQVDWPWFYQFPAFLWQQSICCGFILLSGFCYSLLSRRPLQRGGIVFLGGAAVSAVTALFLPDQQVLFGILTLLGSCMLLFAPLRPLLNRIPPWSGLVLSLLLFGLTYHISHGILGPRSHPFALLPQSLYQNLFTAYLGLPPASFSSTDYFPLLPWALLFLAGLFLGRLCLNRQPLPRALSWGIRPLCSIGRHALPIYLLHQPILYVCLRLVFL